MKTVSAALLGSALLLATPAFAASPFDGTWKGDPKSAVLDMKPDEFALKDGTYTCKTCQPPYSTKADGQFHAVADRPYWDDVAITIVNDREVKMQMRKAGKPVAENVRTVSADGMTLTVAMNSSANGAGTPVVQSSVQTRVGAPVPGAHLVSGAWRVEPKQTDVSENALMLTLKIDGGRLHMTSPLGETLDAKLGGDFAPNVNDPGKTMTKAALLAPDKLELTDRSAAGKVTQVTTYTVSADGKRIDAAWTDPRNGAKGTFVAMKQ